MDVLAQLRGGDQAVLVEIRHPFDALEESYEEPGRLWGLTGPFFLRSDDLPRRVPQRIRAEFSRRRCFQVQPVAAGIHDKQNMPCRDKLAYFGEFVNGNGGRAEVVPPAVMRDEVAELPVFSYVSL